MMTLRIPQATSSGYIECPEGGVFDASYQTSKNRRGRVQGGGMITPTLTSAGSENLIFIEKIMEEEKWLPVPGFEEEYSISSWGRIRTTSIGGHRPDNGLMALSENSKGYLTVGFSISRKKQVRKFVHRLVAECFVPNPDNLPQVNHIDGDKKNNYYENLEWVDNRRNQLHAVEAGLKKDNKRVGQYDLNGNLIKEWLSMSEAVRSLNLCVAHISQCANGIRNQTGGYIWKII